MSLVCNGYLKLFVEYLNALDAFYQSPCSEPLTLFHKMVIGQIRDIRVDFSFNHVINIIINYCCNDPPNSSLCEPIMKLLNLMNWNSEFLLVSHEENYLQRNIKFDLDHFRRIHTTLLSFPPFTSLNQQFDALWSDKHLLCLLRHVFQKEEFRPLQLEAIKCSLNRGSILCLFPTGYGKSLTYMLPCTLIHGITVVFSPLCSLIADQLKRCESLGIPAVWIKANTISENDDSILNELNIRIPRYRLIFLTPEKFNSSEKVRRTIGHLYTRNLLKSIVIDEVHCLSIWGHSFRPSYIELCQIRLLYPETPILALTATATGAVIMDIKTLLRIPNCTEFRLPFNRPNLGFNVVMKKKTVVEDIYNLIINHFPGKSGIIYCRTKLECEHLQKMLERKKISCKFYHSAIDQKAKDDVLKQWQENDVSIVIGTIAFGMGVDKADVRFIIHHSIPTSAACYLQACGRAGRDGLPSHCYLFYGHSDLMKVKSMLQLSEGSFQVVEKKLQDFSDLNRIMFNNHLCRRKNVLLLFDEKRTDRCRIPELACDTCQLNPNFSKINVMRESYLVMHFLDGNVMVDEKVLCKIIAGEYQGFPRDVTENVNGILKHWDTCYILDFIDFLLERQYLYHEYRWLSGIPVSYLSVTDYGKDVYRNIETLSDIEMDVPSDVVVNLQSYRILGSDLEDPLISKISDSLWRKHCPKVKLN